MELELIQELSLPKVGKIYQFIFDSKVGHYFVCKKCGELKKWDQKLFKRIEKYLQDLHDFSKSQLSVVFYGYCNDCAPKKSTKELSV
jgi:Fe2+ or Zn2+ uptake regulation protein